MAKATIEKVTGCAALNWTISKASAMVGVFADGSEEPLRESGYFRGRLAIGMAKEIHAYAQERHYRHNDGSSRSSYLFKEAGRRFIIGYGSYNSNFCDMEVQWERDYTSEEEYEAYTGKYEYTAAPRRK